MKKNFHLSITRKPKENIYEYKFIEKTTKEEFIFLSSTSSDFLDWYLEELDKKEESNDM